MFCSELGEVMQCLYDEFVSKHEDSIRGIGGGPRNENPGECPFWSSQSNSLWKWKSTGRLSSMYCFSLKVTSTVTYFQGVPNNNGDQSQRQTVKANRKGKL